MPNVKQDVTRDELRKEVISKDGWLKIYFCNTAVYTLEFIRVFHVN